MAIVKRDLGTSLGPLLTMTGLCRSSDHAFRELNRMLDAWARQIQGGQAMSVNRRYLTAFNQTCVELHAQKPSPSRRLAKQAMAEWSPGLNSVPNKQTQQS